MKKRRVMIVASGGGHWVQMMRLRDTFDKFDSFYVGVKEMYRDDVIGRDFYAIPDVSRMNKMMIVATVAAIVKILVKERPAVIITTGSAPGALALRLGKLLLRSKTVWIDSMANVEEMSYSGRSVGRYADLWLTQWPHLARLNGPKYIGSVL